MNPLPVVFSLFGRHRATLIAFVVLITFAVALGVAMTAQERALRQGSARAADAFDLVVGAPGSAIDLVLATVYLRVTAIELIDPAIVSELMTEERAEWVAPLAFGDSYLGNQVVGTTQVLVDHIGGGLAEGRAFATHDEAVVGADVPLALGDRFRAAHGEGLSEEDLHLEEISVVGRMGRTGTPWDRALIRPVEAFWEVHGLPTGHPPGDETIGPPFDPAFLPGVPAVIIKPESVAAAYGLRGAYRTERTTALFPAEVLVQLYAILGDARAVLGVVSVATQALVVAAILSGLLVILQLYQTRLAVLRALGATRVYVFLVAWIYVTLLVAAGALLGLALGYVGAQVASAWLTAETGIAVSATLSMTEVSLVLALLAAGAVLAALPAFAVYRKPVIEGLR